MNRIIESVLAMVAVAVMSSCQPSTKEQVIIEGTISGGADKTVYLEEVSHDGNEIIDSVVVASDGSVRFAVDCPEHFTFHRIHFGSDIMPLVTDTLVTTLSFKSSSEHFTRSFEWVQADESNFNIVWLVEQKRQLDDAIDEAYERRQSLTPVELQTQIIEVLNAYKDSLNERIIFAHPNTPEAYFALHQQRNGLLYFDPYDQRDLRSYSAVATSYEVYRPNHPYTATLKQLTLQGMAQLRHECTVQEKQATILSQAKEYTYAPLRLIDNQGEERLLTDVVAQHKKVLLAFHAFNTKESPDIIATLREWYKRKSPEGWEIYMVSLDDNLFFWQNAVRTLPWVNVSDASATSVTLYNLQEIPTMFILEGDKITRVNNFAELK